MKAFKKFCHIEASYSKPLIERIKSLMNPNDLWVAQEKVDGSNFSFIVGKNDNGEIEISNGRRGAELEPNESFYNYQTVVDRIKDNVIALFNEVAKTHDVSEGINVFGELFGGIYPNHQSNVSAVMKRIYYSPNIEFYGFDIYIPSEGYLSPIEAVELFDKVNIFHAENLFIGTLAECLALNTVFPSTIGTRLGYEPIEGNEAEGYVLKPVTPWVFGNGDRVVLKHKNPKFLDVQKQKAPKVEYENSSEYEALLNSVTEFINPNRLNSVLSHIGEVNMPKDFSKVLKEMNDDVNQEFLTDITSNKDAFDALPKAEQKMFFNAVSKLNAQVIKEQLMTA